MENRRIVLLGCGSANLFAAFHLVDSGIDPELITIIDAGGEPATRSSMLKGFAGAGLKSDGKFVFSLHKDPLSRVMDDDKKRWYHKYIQDVMMRYIDIDPTGISNPTPEVELSAAMCSMDDGWEATGMDLRQSTVWHIGTDTELVMACKMYDHMIDMGINMLLNHNAVQVDMDNRIILCKHKGNMVNVPYDVLQVGVGKVGVPFVEELVARYNIPINHGYANIGGRFETKCNDTIKKFADDIQYDFKFYKEYILPTSGVIVGIRTFCTCNYSAYVMEEGIEGTRTYNGHAYGKNHEKENGMTNFGVIARIDGVDALKLHRDILSKHGKKGCAVRGINYDGHTTIKKVGDNLTWDQLGEMYSGTTDNIGSELVEKLKEFIDYINVLLNIGDNYSYYVPEIKMAAGVIETDDNYRIADGRYPEVTWVGDSCSGSVGIVPAALTGIRGIEQYNGGNSDN